MSLLKRGSIIYVADEEDDGKTLKNIMKVVVISKTKNGWLKVRSLEEGNVFRVRSPRVTKPVPERDNEPGPRLESNETPFAVLKRIDAALSSNFDNAHRKWVVQAIKAKIFNQHISNTNNLPSLWKYKINDETTRLWIKMGPKERDRWNGNQAEWVSWLFHGETPLAPYGETPLAPKLRSKGVKCEKGVK